MTLIKIAITATGLCTPLGDSGAQILPRLRAGDTSAMVWRDDLLASGPTLVGEVSLPLPAIPAHMASFDCRNNRLLLSAAMQIAPAVERAIASVGKDRIGVVLGTSTSGIAKGEEALAYRAEHGEFPDDYHYFQQELGSTSDFVRQYFELDGPCYTLSTACSSSAKVFASAKRLLHAKLCDMVIVGGVDSLCRLTVNGFDSLESVSKGHCNPFSVNRDGINIGEGAALFTLVRGEGPVLLAGCGESGDAHHISAPHPEGLGAINAMQAALKDAGLKPADIDYINLHGTATPKNDAMESRAVNAVFEGNLPRCSSTKPLTGHALGAAGALEAAFCVLLLSDANPNLPPQVWDGIADANDPQLPLVPVTQPPLVPLKQIAGSGEIRHIRHVMSNSFAFGGSNASLIFSRGGQHD